MRASRTHPPRRGGKARSFPVSFVCLALAAAIALAACGGDEPRPAARRSPTPAEQAAGRAIDWLQSQQKEDGSIGGDVGMTAEFVLAITAARRSALRWSPSPVAYLERNVKATLDKGPGLVAKVVLAVEAAGLDATSFGGTNLIEALQEKGSRGVYDPTVIGQSLAVLALAVGGEPQSEDALRALVRTQNPDGGWSFDGKPKTGSDTNTTALAIQALRVIEAGQRTAQRDEAVKRALAYLRTQQADDGGFPYQRESSVCTGPCPGDANSTAYVINALSAAGVDLDGEDWTKGGKTPVAALLAMQKEDGSFPGFSPVLSTVQAVPGLVAQSLVCVAAGMC